MGQEHYNATLFIADEDGNIDADTIFSDPMQMLENISNYEFDFGFVKGRIDGGICLLIYPQHHNDYPLGKQEEYKLHQG